VGSNPAGGAKFSREYFEFLASVTFIAADPPHLSLAEHGHASDPPSGAPSARWLCDPAAACSPRNSSTLRVKSGYCGYERVTRRITSGAVRRGLKLAGQGGNLFGRFDYQPSRTYLQHVFPADS
jgi:hypothetical protein